MRFLGVIKKLNQVGFDDFHQAGSINRFRPMNIVAESRILNLQFWICADGGYGVPETYHISERPLDNCNASTERTDFKTQAELIAALEQIRLKIAAAARSKCGTASQKENMEG